MNISDLDHLKLINHQTAQQDPEQIKGAITSRINRLSLLRPIFPDSSATVNGNFDNPGRIDALVNGAGEAIGTNTFTGFNFLTWTFSL
ncbi:hypothetical protein [Crocosphaera subtropica]|uniref:hypothetical protein n=1 Tax=Crocosphaera subtropica TaxID=2546360 RepID=UPI0002313E8F|nr:hypothetical protein [Crocosphaera subtropica]